MLNINTIRGVLRKCNVKKVSNFATKFYYFIISHLLYFFVKKYS